MAGAVEFLQTKLARAVSKKEEIAQIGAISANNDYTIGNMLADAVAIIGSLDIVFGEIDR